MASNIIVLTPNGRRQNVKVTPNTTILQILEEVCKKQGFKADEYDVKHHNKILDVSAIIRFSGLPNNAQLEMCAIQKARTNNPVVLGLQLENGTRLTGNFIPEDNLWNIINKLCPEEISNENLIVIYMRQEIYGEESFKNTSLKSLGLSGGRAMFRLIHRNPEDLRVQANISAPIPPKVREEKPYVRKLQKIELEPEETSHYNRDKSEKIESEKVSKSEDKSVPAESKKSNFLTDFIKKEKAKKSTDVSKYKNYKQSTEMKKEKNAENFTPDDITVLGSRSAIAFSLDVAPTVPYEELPDEFFDLTIQDARKLLRDLRRKREDLEHSPLQTAALRKLEDDKRTLRTLNQHRKTILRIQFPDRTVLQGSFKPLETVKDVKNFVIEYLAYPTLNFHLYTTPPKNILSEEMTLLNVNCVPSALIHFSYNDAQNDSELYLRKSLINKFVSHSLASVAAARSRGYIPGTRDIEPEENFDMEMGEDINVGASTSSYNEDSNYSESIPSPRKYEPQEKIPKWFKPGK